MGQAAESDRPVSRLLNSIALIRGFYNIVFFSVKRSSLLKKISMDGLLAGEFELYKNVSVGKEVGN
jgi:hypothetical protein